jgi:hypothetical protein
MYKVIKVDKYYIEFEEGYILSSDHERSCCEDHYLDFSHITLEDFDNLEFDLTNDNFFNRIENYGIELMPIKGHSVRIPGYAYNNGYYSYNLSLVLENKDLGYLKTFDITECQVDKY